jgi:phage shock protein A
MALKKSTEDLLTPEVCQSHDPCKELRSECAKVQEKWEELRKKVEHILAGLMAKVSSIALRVCHKVGKIGVHLLS